MNIRVLGAGIYGCHLAASLLDDGHEVEIWESADHVFAGASGNMPARLHTGQHYPRSQLTRRACQRHYVEFMQQYGDYTSGVEHNIYAIAERDSLVDLGTYVQILSAEIRLEVLRHPNEFGLKNVEGAILTDERHVLVDKLAIHFMHKLGDRIEFGIRPEVVDDQNWDLTIDCTGCAFDEVDVDRYEPCLTMLLEGPTDIAVTIMDGPFPSLYPWDEEKRLSSLTSAKWTPFGRFKTWHKAKSLLDGPNFSDFLEHHATEMWSQIAFYYPRVRDEYRPVHHCVAIRPMPASAADARLLDVRQTGHRVIRIRSGKLDAIF